MDIKRFNVEGDWLEFEVDSDKDIKIKLKIQPVSSTELLEVVDSRNLDGLFIAAVAGWDLTDGEAPLAFTSENKQKYLPRIGAFTVRAVNGEPVAAKWNILSYAIDYARRPENFLKN